MRPSWIAAGPAIAAAFVGSVALAQTLHTEPFYSKAYDRCMAKAQASHGYPEREMGECNDAEWKRRDASLNAAYLKALARVGVAQDDLKAAERAWIAYRDADCAVYQNQGEFGTLGGVDAGRCMIDRTIERTEALKAFFPDSSGAR